MGHTFTDTISYDFLTKAFVFAFAESLQRSLGMNRSTNSYLVAHASIKDTEEVRGLVCNSFSYWKSFGLDLSPMSLTSFQAQELCLGNSLIIRNGDKNTIGFIAFEKYSMGITESVLTCKRPSSGDISYISKNSRPFVDGDYISFNKLSLAPDLFRLGIGSQILTELIKCAEKFEIKGLALETVREADWLYKWYSKNGFLELGTYRYERRPLETVLMARRVNGLQSNA